jgi:ABC-2 type transport system permease protein
MTWWRSVMAMELRKILAYRSDFWITFLGQTFIQLFIARALWQSIFESQKVTQMNGYTLPMMTLYYLLAALGNKILMGENIGFISREIYDGTFSRYLIYPLSPFTYKRLTYFTHSLFYGLQLLFIFLIFCFFNSVEVHPLELLMGLCLFLLAALTYCSMATMIELLALWADNIWSLMVMLRFFTLFLGGGMIPLTFYPEEFLEILKLTPFPYLLNLPIKTVMGQSDLPSFYQGAFFLILWTLILNGVVKLIWSRGQKQFTGVGI